jgi:translocation and assembly module TamB
MTTASPARARRRKRTWFQVAAGLFLLVAAAGLGVYLRSDAFRELVRRKAIAQLESITGGRVEIQSLSWNLYRLEFEATGVTVHGREASGQPPLLHIDRASGQAKILSFLRRNIGLRWLVIDHPVVHLIVYPDGTTNQPITKIREQNSGPVQRLFDLAVNRLEINSAELLLNDRKIAFDFTGNNLSGDMSHSRTNNTYEGNLSVELMAVRSQTLEQLEGGLELRFVVHPSQLEVKLLKFKMGGSTLDASGTMTDSRQPDIHLQYRASVELKDVARMARIPQLQGGHLEVNGSGHYQNRRYETAGTLAGSSFIWREKGFHLTGVDVASPFVFTTDKVSLPAVKIKALGGSAQGEFVMTRGNAGPQAKAPLTRGTANLQLAGIQLSQLAAAISTHHLPFDKINLAGGISGEMTGAWSGSVRDATLQLKLDVDPPRNPGPQQLPVTARVDATYHHGSQVLDVAGLSFATRAIRLNATGTLGSTAAQLKVAFNANDLREIQPVLTAWSSDAQVPLDVHGRASFNGTLFGTLQAISARGRLDFDDFDSLLGPIHALLTQNAPTRIHWDSMRADVRITPSSINAQNGLLTRGATQVLFSGSATLNQGQLDARSSVMTANLRVQNGNLAQLQSLAGLRYPITGIFNASARVSGPLRNLRGSGNLSATKLTFYGEPFSLFRSDINFAGQETQFNNIQLLHNSGQLAGSAAVNPVERSVRFDLRGANLELADFSRLEPQRFPLSGLADFHAFGSGTLKALSMNGELTVRGLAVNGDLIGDLRASAQTQGENMLLRAGISYQSAAFNLDGSMQLRENFPAEMTLKFDHLDLDPLLRAYVKPSIPFHSLAQGYIELRGPMATPRELSVQANISQFSANVENVKVHNEGPLRFSVGHQAVHVDQFRLLGEETDLSLHGDANMGGTQSLDVHADGKVDLKLLQTLDHDITSSGMAVLALHLAGSARQPQMRGRVDITDGAISAMDMPNGLSRINGRLALVQDRLQIENLRAHTGGGDMDLTGFIAYRGGLYFDLTATGNDVRVRYPPGLSASLNASLRYTGSAEASLLSGDATLIRLGVDPRFDFAQYLARAKSPGRGGAQNRFLESMRLDIHVVSKPELRVETSLAKVAGDADLRIRGTAANPALLGRVNIAEGDVSFSGTKYRLQHGDVTFSNPQVIQPVINVEMAGRVRDYDITIGFHGPVDKLNITYRSEPPMSSSDIIALLAFGRTKQQDVYTNQSTTTLTTSDTMLEQALTTASTSRVQKLFGVGSVKIDPQVIGPENNLGPRVTIEQQIQNNITLTYITNVAQSSSEQVIQVEYNLSKSISVVAVRDQNGIVTFEVRIKKRKK